MIVLFLLFLVQFSVACACLAVNEEQQHELASRSWSTSSNQTKQEAQKIFDCCGFENETLPASDPYGHPKCNAVSFANNELITFNINNQNFVKLILSLFRMLNAVNQFRQIFVMDVIYVGKRLKVLLALH